VSRDQLLLLTDRIQESERVRAESDQRQRSEREQADARARERGQALPSRGGENQEREQQPGGDLDPHAGNERGGSGPEAHAAARRERERDGEDEQDQRVVVGAADRQHQQHRVQADEGGGPASRAPEASRRPGDERHRCEARRDREPLERPQRAGDAEGRDRIA